VGSPSTFYGSQNRNGSGERFYLRFQGYAVPVPCPPCPVQVPAPWSGTHPLLSSAVLCCPLLSSAALLSSDGLLSWSFCGSPAPLCPFLARAAAANVNPRTRLSHVKPLSGGDWGRCRLMMQNSQNSLPVTPKILRRARDSPRIFPGF
jgi:hypothetical protein